MQQAAGDEAVQDAGGNSYGTTTNGGEYGHGTVFEITSAGEYIVLHSFDGADGVFSQGTLLLGAEVGL